MLQSGSRVSWSAFFSSHEGVVVKMLGSEKALVRESKSGRVQAMKVSDLEEVA